MSVHLFDDRQAREKVIPARRYIIHMRRLVCGSKDVIHALRSFEQLVFSPPSISEDGESVQSFLDFDAHPGDCACQVRPVGLHQIFVKFRKSPQGTRADLDWTIELLQQLHDRALWVHQQLCDTGAPLERIADGLNRDSMTINELYAKTGVQGWFDLIDNRISMGDNESDYVSSHARSGSPARSDSASSDAHPPTPGTVASTDDARLTVESLASLHLDAGGLPKGQGYDASPNGLYTPPPSLPPSRRPSQRILSYAALQQQSSGSDMSSSSLLLEPLERSKRIRDRALSEVWDVEDWFMVVQFLTYSNMLARFKSCVHKPGADAFIYRLSPKLAWEEHLRRDGDELQCRFRKGPARCPWRKREDTWKLAEQELGTMQTWLSNISCRLVRSLCLNPNLPEGLHAVACETMRQGPRSIGVLPTFLTIAPIRHYWFEAKAPIFLVLQRFCDHGYHSNYFKITPNQISNRDGVDDFWAASYDFKIEVARQDDPELNSMNICVIANSVNGTPNAAQDLIKLITSGSERAHHHNDAQCSDNVKVVNEMLNASVDEMFMTFFAQHCNYPFAVDDSRQVEGSTSESSHGEDAASEPLDPLASSFALHELDDWNDWHKQLKERSDRLGTSYSHMDLCVPQHMFAERPTNVIRIHEERIKRGGMVILPGFIEDFGTKSAPPAKPPKAQA